MLDKIFIENEIKKLIVEKKYDVRIAPMLKAFFTAVSERYNYTEENLKEAVEEYKKNVDEISFYNVGMNNYKYGNKGKNKVGLLVLDAELTESPNEQNIESYLGTVIRANSIMISHNNTDRVKQIIQMSYMNKLLGEKTGELEKVIEEMLEHSYNTTDIVKTYNEQLDEYYRINRKDNPDRYYYLSDTNHTILSDINEQLEKIQNGENVKEAFKTIYTLCLFNIKLKIDSKLDDENTWDNYNKLNDTFNKYKDILGITDGELSNEVCIDDKSNWKLIPNKLKKEIEEKIRFKSTKERKEQVSEIKGNSFFDKKQILEEQRKANQTVDKEITEEFVRQKVQEVIEDRKYQEEFIPIIHEYFKRSVKDLNWDRETLEKKLENLRTNVERIEYSHILDDTYVAQYTSGEKSIQISTSVSDTTKEEMASTLMHELKHATDHTKRDLKVYEEGFKYQENENKYLGQEDSIQGINELVTEMTAMKLMGINSYRDRYSTTYKLVGYDRLTFAGSMLSSALGMTEIEFIKHSNKGNKKFEDLLEEKYPGLGFGEKMKQIDDIIITMNMKNGESTRKRYTQGYANIYNIINDMYQKRVEADKETGNYDEEKSRYDEYKINKNMILAQNKLFLNRWKIRKQVPEYDKIREKAKIKTDEKEAFKERAEEIKEQFEIRDNKEIEKDAQKIIRKAKTLRRKAIFYVMFGKKLKALPEGKDRVITGIKDNFSDIRKRFLDANRDNNEERVDQQNTSQRDANAPNIEVKRDNKYKTGDGNSNEVLR